MISKEQINIVFGLIVALLIATLIIQIVTGVQEVRGRYLDNKSRKIDNEGRKKFWEKRR